MTGDNIASEDNAMIGMLGFLAAKFVEAPCRLRHPVPDLGADSDAVLQELGYSVAEITRLRAAGVV